MSTKEGGFFSFLLRLILLKTSNNFPNNLYQKVKGLIKIAFEICCEKKFETLYFGNSLNSRHFVI